MSVDHRYQTTEPRHPIQVVSKRTGLSQDVIRAWERRHRAVSPGRSGTARRLFSDDEVDRLVLLRRATILGRRIGDVAHLPTEELRALVEADEAATNRVPQAATAAATAHSPLAHAHLDACLDGLRRFDPTQLESALGNAALALAPVVLIERVLAPLMRQIGEMWQAGSLSIRHEHMATVLVRALLGTLRAAYTMPRPGPEIVVTTPAGQIHEVGALMAAVTAAAAGWRVAYLGPNMPAEEIASAVVARRAKAVALSLVFPEDDPKLPDEIRRLRGLLANDVVLLIGGPCVRAYERVIREAGATLVPDMTTLSAELDALR
jgi:methanogenic corrinoid protein MtbC1